MGSENIIYGEWNMKKHPLLLCMMAVSVVGCTLEEVVERSNTKCDAEYTEANGMTCYLNPQNDEDSGCGESYRNAMKIGFCPMNLDTCATDANGIVYCHVTCKPGQVYCNGGCIDPSTDMNYCGAKGNCFNADSQSDDYQGAKCAEGTTCSVGKCHASTSCLVSQHEDATGVCVENTVEMCGTVSCIDLPGWKVGRCDINKCIVTECQKSYHIDSKTELCVADSPSCCGAECADCGNGSCSNGKCVTGKACDTGQHLNRDNECEDDTLENCGRVGFNCHSYGLKEGDCIDGECVPTSCKASYHLDVDVCIMDSSECCGVECKDCGASICVAGECSTSSCTSSQYVDPVSGECVENSVQSCGRYDNDCSSLAGWLSGECNAGKCEAMACLSGYHIDANKKQCIADTNECCGSECRKCGELEKCQDAACVVSGCVQGEELCSGVCIDITSDINNCGGCSSACRPQRDADVVNCDNQRCVYSCNSGLEQCGSAEIPNCVDIKTNGNYCGNCTTKCSSDESCKDGRCVPNECAIGKHKVASGECVDDTKNACGPNARDCASVVSNASDVKCVSAQCFPASCASNYHMSTDGTYCEKDGTDACGSYNNSCMNISDVASADCVSGKCVVKRCDSGKHVNSSATGCEDDSVSACGAVGNACSSKSHAAVSCPNGTCRYQCDTGYTDCNGNPSNPNCLSLSSDAGNCGLCGNKCQSKTNAKTPTCSGGQCQYQCDTGYTNCNTATNPSCIKINGTDVNNCGACGSQCQSKTNAKTPTCSGGKCQYQCNPGYTNCGSATAPNCLNVNGSDVHNCGGCNISCKSGQYCEGGVCQWNSCPANQHLHPDDGCVADTLTDCGASEQNCTAIPNQTGVICSSKCIVQSCKSGYHVNENATGCSPNDDEDCGPNHINCKTNNPKSNATNFCTLTTGTCNFMCDDNYHKNSSGTACEADSITACGSYSNNCTKLAGWKNGGCYKGSCRAVTCQYNYFLVNNYNTTNCEKNSQYVCGGMQCSSILPETYNSSYTCYSSGSSYRCQDSWLDMCGDSYNGGYRYNIYTYLCSDSYSSSMGWKTSCGQEEHMGCSRNNYISYPTCSSGQHISGRGCEENNRYNCGKAGIDCEMAVAGWDDGDCIDVGNYDGLCSAESCMDGYEKVSVYVAGKTIYRCKPNFTIY